MHRYTIRGFREVVAKHIPARNTHVLADMEGTLKGKVEITVFDTKTHDGILEFFSMDRKPIGTAAIKWSDPTDGNTYAFREPGETSFMRLTFEELVFSLEAAVLAAV